MKKPPIQARLSAKPRVTQAIITDRTPPKPLRKMVVKKTIVTKEDIRQQNCVTRLTV